MNILGFDFMSFVAGDFEQALGDKLLREFIGMIRCCGNHENPTNIGMMTTVIDI